jgi:hypothetical protein
MSADKQNEKNKIDDLFKDHFNTMPKFDENENKDKILFNTVLAQAKIKRDSIHKEVIGELNFFHKVKEYFIEFSILSPKYAIPLATLVVTTFAILYLSFNNTSNNISIAKKDTLILENNQILNQKPLNNNDLATNNEMNDEKISNEVNSTDFGSINYDFSTRVAVINNIVNNRLNDLVNEIIIELLDNMKIKFSKSDNVFATEWLRNNNQLIQINLNIDSNNKSIKLNIKNKKYEDKLNYKKINPKDFKKQLENRIYNLFSNIE